VRERYAVAARTRAQWRRELLASAGVDSVEIRVGEDVIAPVAAYFRLRALRR
jgi:hypothetical protein